MACCELPELVQKCRHLLLFKHWACGFLHNNFYNFSISTLYSLSIFILSTIAPDFGKLLTCKLESPWMKCSKSFTLSGETLKNFTSGASLKESLKRTLAYNEKQVEFDRNVTISLKLN